MSDPSCDPNRTHVGIVVDRLKGIPPEKFKQKLGRTIAGLAFIAAGLKGGPLLMGAGVNKEYVPTIVTVLLVAGAVLASFEFIVAPLQIGLALTKDAVNIFVCFVQRKKANGDDA